MLKASLIAIAALVAFDAVALDGSIRTAMVHQTVIAVHSLQGLDWSWG